MTALVVGSDAFDAWRNVSALLLAAPGGDLPCVVTMISDGALEDKNWYRDYDARRPSGFDKLRTVVEVLAPDVLSDLTVSRTDKYDAAWKKFDRFRGGGRRLSGWHDTYFERLTRRPPSNRLESLIDALNRWGTNPAAALYAHIEGTDSQSLRTRGSPCLQYLQFGVSNGAMELTGVYRSHDFERKALGNFIGLTRILRFVAHETGRSVGKVRCVSLHAYCTSKSNLTKLAT